ncbi:MAG: lipoate--protein ligase [Spirochaetaceae bacterium]|jgi:lipoate-protein ligase A|nr:lipoate--protein ligase [Spirochaetaceae bacterium]
MIRNTLVIDTTETNPWRNLALESFLLENTPADTCVLYLWQNRHTVVIGRNQNARKECRVAELEADDGFLARRLSGGGAVYHDMGNLNFTFLLPSSDYDLGLQTDVILRAVRSLGVDAQKSGRNDIETQGRKFSGNAFYKAGNNSYHHGTILIRVDHAAAQKYLSVPQDKIKSKGVDSVKSRIINLVECNPVITIDKMKAAMRASFDEAYKIKAGYLTLENAHEKLMLPDDVDIGKTIAAHYDVFSSEDWRYGKDPPFEWTVSNRFAWGGIEVRLLVKKNIIEDAAIFSDSMDVEFILALPKLLKGCAFNEAAVKARLQNTEASRDLIQLIFGGHDGYTKRI